MGDLEQRLRQLVSASDPDGTVTVRWLASLIGESVGELVAGEEPLGDLTVADVAEIMRRAPSTVRGWLSRGELQGYRLNGRDWRVTRQSLREYQAEQSRQQFQTPPGEVNIGAWRQAS